MSGRYFTSKLPATDLFRKFEKINHSPEHLFRDAVKFHTQVVVCGATVQFALCAFLPLKWAAVPAAIILANAAVTTILQVLSPTNNGFMEGVVPGRVTAQLPSETGVFGPDPAEGSIVVFNLGVQFNHPLGFFCPGSKEVGKAFFDMTKELRQRAEELGILGMSEWRTTTQKSNNGFVMTFHFKDVASIHRFAHEELHRTAWDMYNGNDWKHIGVYHETFEVPAKAYETMYVNCRPVLLGKGQVKCDADDGEKWLSMLVSANTPALKTQYARMGRDERGVEKA